MRTPKLTALAAVPILLAATAGTASADNIQDSLSSTSSTVNLVAGSTATGTAGIKLVGNNAQGDPDPGCNIDAGEAPLVLDIVTPAGITANPDPLSILECGRFYDVTFTASSTAVSGNVTVRVVSGPAGGGTYQNQVNIPISVSQPPPPANTAPSVSISGVAGGQSYAKGSVPDAWCDVTDAEDGPSRFRASLSAVSGPYSADGIGSQTAECSYTDRGGLTATSAETYGIVDPTAPAVSYSLNAADGDNGWHRGDAVLTWSVEEPESPRSLVTSGCVDQTVTEDQPATEYTCSATSAGGDSGVSTVTIKRDATAPTGVSFTGGPAGDTAYYANNVPAAPTCTADDATSGLASCVVSGYSAAVGTHTLTATATDRAGNVSTETRTYTVRTLRISGFTSPVDMGRVTNVVKAGSTVPLKFEVFDGTTELQDVAKVKGLTVRSISCSTQIPEDAIETLSSGSTSLRYDTANGGQYIQNWKTPSQVGKCYEATLTTEDDSSVSALFRLR